MEAVYTKESLIREVNRWVRNYGDKPLQTDWHGTASYPSPHAVKNHFGSWNSMIREAGYKPNPHNGGKGK